MRIFTVTALLFSAVLFFSCSGRDEIVNPLNTQTVPILIYSRQGSIDSVACLPQNSKNNIKYLDSINFIGTDSIRLFFKYSVCNPGTSYFELFYFDGLGARTTMFNAQLSSSGTFDRVIRSPFIYRRMYTELFTSSAGKDPNCIIIKDLNIYRH